MKNLKDYRFKAASAHEIIVFGAARPGYTDEEVLAWIDFVRQKDIQRVCCLLAQSSLDKYSNLLETYRQKFGEDRVCWAPIEDFHLCDLSMLNQQILPFLATAEQHQQKVIVHCGGGIGRTGHILAAWLVYRYQYSNREAIATVMKMGRNPYESAIFGVFKGRNIFTSINELNLLLDGCRSNY